MTFFTFTNLLIFLVSLLPVIAVAWVFFTFFLRPRMIPACAVAVIAELLISRHGPKAAAFAEDCEKIEWKRSKFREVGLWRRVRCELQRRHLTRY